MSQALYSLPRYEQIKTFIRNQIESGQWSTGDSVPSENQLAMDFSVSRMTARRALQELADENLLLRSPGLGTFVAEPQVAAPLLEISDFSRQYSFSNPEYSNRILTLQEVSGETKVSSVLVGAGGSVVSVNRGSLYQLSCSAVGAMLYQSGRGAGLPETELLG